jgi:autotransporter-associated beta strand protein
VGDAGGTGNFYQSGGTVTVNGSMTIGNESGKGTYSLFDGPLALAGGLYTVGRNSGANAVSTGSLMISGGVVDVQTGNLVIGNSVSATGAQSSGLIQQTGGTVTIGAGAGLYLSGYGTGEYDLNGGILQVGGSNLNTNYNSGGAAYTFKLGGGTIQVIGTALTASANATLVTGTTSTIDTNNLGATWSGALTGGGGLTKIGLGTLTLSGANTYSGGTTIEAGTLQLGSATALPTGKAVTFSGDGTLNLNGHNASIGALSGTSGTIAIGSATLTLGTDNSSSSFGGVFTGTGTGDITKSGTGTLTLTGDNSSFTGSTIISAGELSLDSSAVLGGSVTVKSGATITASGTIDHNYTQNAGATMIVQASSSSASSLKVGGTASIAGALSVEATTGQYDTTTNYTILTATGGVTGKFGTVSSDLAFLTPTLTYSANSIDLTLTRNASTFASIAGTANQRSVGAALDQLSVNGPAALTPFFNAALSQTTAQATATLDHVGSSAQIASVTSSVALDAGQHFASAMMQAPGLSGPPAQYTTSQPTRLQFASADPLDVQAQAAGARPKDSRWGAWATGDSINGKIAGDGNSADTNYNSDGEAFGIDYRLSRSWMIGISGGHVSTTASIDSLGASTKIDSNSAGIYTGFRSGSLYATASIGYAHNDEQDTRSVVVEGLATSTATATPHGNQALGAAEIGYDFRGPAQMTITPLVGVDASVFNQPSYTESGAGALDLTVASKSTKEVRTMAGAQIFDSFWLTDVRWLDLEMRGAWAHEVTSDDRLVSAQFAEAPGSGFVVSGARPKRDAALVGIGVATPLIRRISLYVRYDGDINGSDNAHGVSGGMRVTW